MLRPLETLSELSPKNGGPMYLSNKQPKKKTKYKCPRPTCRCRARKQYGTKMAIVGETERHDGDTKQDESGESDDWADDRDDDDDEMQITAAAVIK